MLKLSATERAEHPWRPLSHGDALGCLEIIHRSLDCQDSQGLCALVEEVGSLIEADYCACLFSTKAPATGADQIVIVDANYPTGWLEHYAHRHFHLIDPIIAENFSRFGLQYWGDTYLKSPPPGVFRGEAEAAGLEHGFSYGLPDRARTGGSLFSFAGPRLPQTARRAMILERILPHLHRVLSQLDTGGHLLAQANALSDRELEVLKWIGAGKSSWEAGMILRIAERTVNFHIRNILLKLDAVNRPQAVATALKLGLLELP
jgi:DNA-binding CsgD family transcriptional regulator